ncbi:MAG: hypothetical protein RLZZ499_2481 [Cyanobacteriota bacterium]
MSHINSENIVNANGQKIRAKAAVGCYRDMKGIFIESRSGIKSSENARNPEYFEGLKIIIARLIDIGCTKLDIWVASAEMQNYDLKKCKIVKDGRDAYYIDSSSNPEEVRKDICSKQTAIKQNKNSKGGNLTKKLFIRVEGNDNFCRSLILGTNRIFKINSDDVNNHEDIDLNEDRRTSILVAIKARRGQNTFRKELMKAYGGKCTITGCEVEEILEAAHISSYKGEHTNIVSNGLLLRADIHTLFDLGLIKVDSNYKVVVSSELSNSEYWQYNNIPLKIIPTSQLNRPSVKALTSR